MKEMIIWWVQDVSDFGTGWHFQMSCTNCFIFMTPIFVAGVKQSKYTIVFIDGDSFLPWSKEHLIMPNSNVQTVGCSSSASCLICYPVNYHDIIYWLWYNIIDIALVVHSKVRWVFILMIDFRLAVKRQVWIWLARITVRSDEICIWYENKTLKRKSLFRLPLTWQVSPSFHIIPG